MPNEWASTDLGPYLDAAPLAWTLALVGMLVVGSILWLVGGKLAKAGAVMAGFVIGGVGVMGAALAWTEGGPFIIGFGVGGALAGALLALLLFRLWIALTAALLLAAVVPAAVLVWTGQTPTTEPIEDAAATVTDTSAALLQDGSTLGDVAGAVAGVVAENATANPDDAGGAASAADTPAHTFVQTLRDAWEAQLEALRTWWAELPGSQKSVVYGGALGGAAVGLLLGLILPNVAAALQTALAGALLIFGAARVLIERYVGDGGYLPDTPRGIILTLGLITLLGLLIQWTLFRKQTDK